MNSQKHTKNNQKTLKVYKNNNDFQDQKIEIQIFIIKFNSNGTYYEEVYNTKWKDLRNDEYKKYEKCGRKSYEKNNYKFSFTFGYRNHKRM